MSEPDSTRNDLKSITSGSITLTVKDEATGRTFTRTLPLDYAENTLGISLTGEDLHGNPATIVFLSEFGIKKMKDVQGMGADKPEQDHH